MKRLIAACSVVALLLLAGCGGSSPKRGQVVNKRHQAAYDDHYWINQCMSYDTKGHCTLSIPIEQTQHHSERWQLDLQECKTNDKGSQHCDEGWLSIDPDTFDQYKIGEFFPRSAENTGRLQGLGILTAGPAIQIDLP